MAGTKEELRNLTAQRKGLAVEHNADELAKAASERTLTAEEFKRWKEYDALDQPLYERSRVLESQLDIEERAMDYADSILSPSSDSTVTEQEWRNLDTGERAAVRSGESFAAHPVAVRAAAADKSAANAAANYGELGAMIRALATVGTGSAIVPTTWAANLIDLARSKAAVTQAGATIVPMESKKVQIGRQTADPTATFRAEGSTIPVSDSGFDSVTLTARTLSALVVATEEFWQDAPNAEAIITNSLAQSMAAQIDLVALYGGITTGAGAINLPTEPNPRGILAALNAQKPANILNGLTNGTNPTVASGLWNEFLDAYFTVKDGNEDPTAAVWSSKLARPYAKAVDTTGQPVGVPAEIQGLPRYVVNKIPSYTKGTSTTATDLFIANFKQLIIGQRLQITIRPLEQLFAGEGKIGVVASWRGDMALARPAAFAVYRALNGAA